MEVKSATEGDILILTPVGRVDTSTAKSFEEEVMKGLAQGSKVAISFSEINYISSAGLRVILMAGKKVASTQGKMALINMPEKIFAVFKMSGFDRILKIVPTLDDAKALFG